MFTYLIGSGFGSPYVGVISDWLKREMGDASLVYAMLACVPVMVLTIVLQLVLAHMLGAGPMAGTVTPSLPGEGFDMIRSERERP